MYKNYDVTMKVDYNVSSAKDEMYEAEDEAWEKMEKVLSDNDVEDYEIGTKEITKADNGFVAKLEVKMLLHGVAEDFDEAYDEVTITISDMDLPDEVELTGYEDETFEVYTRERDFERD